MQQMVLKPQIHTFETFAGFAKEFGLSKDDLIFTEKFIYETYIKELNLSCSVLLRDPYGLGEPSDNMIDNISAEAKKYSFSRIIAVGGGSVIDIAKIFALKNNVPSAKIFTKETPVQKEKQLVIIPTTCGTGSEVTNLSIAHIHAKETKMGIADDKIYADFAVLIPQLVEGLPYKFTVFSAIDALVHSFESYLSPRSNVFTEIFSLKAGEMLLQGFGELIEKGPEAKKALSGNFIKASCMAGIAFANAGVGPVHALAYPLGGNYHVPHGETNYQFFAEVFKLYLRKKPGSKLEILGNLAMSQLNRAGIACSPDNVFDKLDLFLEKMIPLPRLHEYGMREEEINSFSQSVMDNQQRLLVNSYAPFTIEDAREIYRNRF